MGVLFNLSIALIDIMTDLKWPNSRLYGCLLVRYGVTWRLAAQFPFTFSLSGVWPFAELDK